MTNDGKMYEICLLIPGFMYHIALHGLALDMSIGYLQRNNSFYLLCLQSL